MVAELLREGSGASLTVIRLLGSVTNILRIKSCASYDIS